MHDQLQKYRFYSKILITFTVIMIGSILSFFMFHSYQQNIKNAQKQELQFLLGIARTVAQSIDGDVHEGMICNFKNKDAITKNDENSEYQKFQNLLQRTQEVNNLNTPIYTLFKDDLCDQVPKINSTFLFGVSSSEPFFRHNYELSPECLHEKYEEGGTIGEYYTENGHWLSAFYPIKNKHDKTIAVVQVDESFAAFEATARETLLNESLFALLFLGLISGVFIFIYHIILKSMSKVNITLEAAVTKRTKEVNKSNWALKKLTEKLENVVEKRTTELNIANEDLIKSNEKLKSFARVASHDLRAPLRLISSFAQLFKRRYSNIVDEDGQEYINYITTNTQKMSDLITDILSTSLLPNENSNAMKMVNLNKVIKDVESNLGADILKYNAQITCQNLPSIQGYASEFLQLFQNLISNSIKYSRADVAPVIEVEGTQNENSFLIKIKDNGKGISAEALENIFEEFNRGDANDDDGYGIGLATCVRIIKEYHGVLNVSSEVGVGTCFEFTIKNRNSDCENDESPMDASLGMALKN